jgi:osmotically-inducible protein OsmY
MRRNGTASLAISLFAAATLAALAACSSSGRDAAITHKVRTVLQADRVVDASTIRVSTDRGVVTLDGSVAGEDAHHKAIALVSSVEGVRQVRDQLTITPAPPAPAEVSPPASPAGADGPAGLGGVVAENRGRSRDAAPGPEDTYGRLAGVVGPQGDVSLDPVGSVEPALESAARREASPAPELVAPAVDSPERGEDAVAASLPGSVAALRGESAEDAAVTARVRSALVETSGRVQVRTRSGVVTLSGVVDTELEREQALRAARSTRGVARVDDRLVVLQS